MSRKISKRRQEMGEEAWSELKKKKDREKSRKTYYKAAQRVVLCRQRKKKKLIEAKGGKCERCGYNKDCPGAYHFHHLYDKSFGLATSNGKNYSLEKSLEEIKKCQLLCSNCHAEVHHEEHKLNVEKRYKELFPNRP